MGMNYHSIWLMPRFEDEEIFAEIVQDLAKRFGSPSFQPHLTLVEDMPRTCDELRPLLQELADGVPPFASPVEAVEGSSLYFRSFYARLSAVAPLRELKDKAIRLFGVGSLEMFMPHISMAYGVPDSPEKIKLISALQNHLYGLSVTFDKAFIVSSSQHTPIEEWKVKDVCHLS